MSRRASTAAELAVRVPENGERVEDLRVGWWTDPSRPYRRWAMKVGWKQKWRVGRQCLEEDWEHDMFCLYLMVLRRYPAAIDPPHVMALFKRVVANWLNDRSYAGALDRQIVIDADLPRREGQETEGDGGLLATVPNTAYEELQLLLVLRELPAEIFQVVETLLTDAMRGTERPRARAVRPKKLRGTYRRRETKNQYLARMTGVPCHQQDIAGALRLALSP